MEHKEYITKTELKNRGWTELLIKKFVAEPHATKPNQMYRSASPIKLYKIKTIISIEKSKTFKKDFEKSSKRKSASKKAVETKEKKLIDDASSTKIEICILTKSELLKQAISHYNERQGFFGEYNYASSESDTLFLERIQVNYIRHMLTQYEAKLDDIFGKVGVAIAYKIIKCKVFETISENYPFLRNECERQKCLLEI